jgi:RNA polymerase-binding transcription factor DksA
MDLVKMKQEIEREQKTNIATLRADFKRLNKDVTTALNEIDAKILEQVTIRIESVFSQIETTLKKFGKAIGEKHE